MSRTDVFRARSGIDFLAHLSQFLQPHSTFGQGYFQVGNRGVNPFAQYIPEYMENVHAMNADVLPTGRMRNMPLEDIIKWFVNDTVA